MREIEEKIDCDYYLFHIYLMNREETLIACRKTRIFALINGSASGSGSGVLTVVFSKYFYNYLILVKH